MTGKCIKGDACECVGNMATLKTLCRHYSVPERQPGDLERRCLENWNRIPADARERCAKHLRAAMSRAPDAFAHFRDQAMRGVVIGSDDIRFHFGVGMVVRNTLREVLPDDRLPGEQNWDDYYYGALDAAVRV